MQANGRVQVSAPKCVAVTGAEGAVGQLRSGIADGQGDNSTKIFSTGDTTLGAAVPIIASTSSTTITVNERCGITDGQTLILGFGTDHEEEVTTGAVTEGTGSGAIALTNGQAINNIHAINERVVVKGSATGGLAYGAIRPGSVVIAANGTPATVTDNGAGVLSGDVTGTVDYSTGHVTVTYGTAPANNAVITYNADKLVDLPDQADLTGSGFQKNFFTATATRQSIPDVMTINNLGSTAVGYFVEVSRNGGKTFTTKNWIGSGSRAGNITAALGRAVVQTAGGHGGIIDAVRLRAGQSSSSVSTADTEAEKRQIWDGVLEVSTQTLINTNGGSA